MALGHRLVLVLTRAEGPAPARAGCWSRGAICARRYGRIIRFRNRRVGMPRSNIEAAAAAGASRAGHRGADRTHGGSSWTSFLATVPPEPIWLCPIRIHDRQRRAAVAALTRSKPAATMSSTSGFWSAVDIAPGAVDGDVNRAIECQGERVGRPQVPLFRCPLRPRKLSFASVAVGSMPVKKLLRPRRPAARTSHARRVGRR